MPPLPHATTVPSNPQQIKTDGPPPLAPGQKFIPHRQFRSGVFLPDVILANPRLSCGAKLLWARLARYAGVDGVCFPSCQTLGINLGCSPRQIQRYVAELVNGGFIRAKQRGFNKSNTYPFLWHPDLNELPRKEPHSATDASPCGTTNASSCVSATDVSSSVSATDASPLSEVKSNKEMQAESAHACEPQTILPDRPACLSPEKAKPEPLTPPETEVMGWLHLFQKDLRIGGTVEASTVREVLKVVSREELPRALKYVAEKIQERRRRDHHYRERVDFGLALTILRQDYRMPGQTNVPLLRQKQPSAGSTPPSAILRPPAPTEYHREPRRATRSGFSRAADIVRESRLFERVNDR